MKSRLFSFFFLCFLWVPSISAQENSGLPTIPIADRSDLAGRFSGFHVQSPPIPSEAAPVQIGDLATFTLTTTESGMLEDVQATVRAISQHAIIWVETGRNIPDGVAARAATRFDGEVYEFTRSLWGSEESPGIDGDPRIHLLFSGRVQENITAYFAAQNTYPRQIIPDSNEKELLIFNLDAFANQIDSDTVVGAAAHEFQHMIHSKNDRNESAWLEEAFSMLTEHLLGRSNSGWAYNAFLANPSTQLNTWGTGENFSAHYGAGMLFLVYLQDRYGLPLLQHISNDPANGLTSIDSALLAIGEVGVDELFADWVLANLIRDPNTGYGYHSLPADAASIAPETVYFLPDTRTGTAHQYSATYFTLHQPPPQIAVETLLPESIGFIPDDGTGEEFFYSNHGDESNPRLTHALDLRNMESAALAYRIWYDLEAYWDYGYISISTDEGRTWQPQETRITTATNPNGKAYGIGFTGYSGGWIEDELRLDAFSGQEILIRFEMVTDDALNQTGIAIKNIRLNIGASEFPIAYEDWQPEGWFLTDNRLPQRAWLQAVQYTGNTVEVTRWLIAGDSQHTLDIHPGTSKVVFVFSPFAPITLQPTPYTLNFRATP